MSRSETRTDQLVRHTGEQPNQMLIDEHWNLQQKIATELGVSRTTATNAIDAGVRKGFFEKEAATRRGTRSITLTEQGRRHYELLTAQTLDLDTEPESDEPEDTQLDTVESDIANNSRSGQKQSSAEPGLRTRNTYLEGRKNALEAEVSRLKSQLGDVPKDAKEAQQTITALKADLDSLQRRLDNLLGKYQLAMREREEYKEAAENLRGRVVAQQVLIREGSQR